MLVSGGGRQWRAGIAFLAACALVACVMLFDHDSSAVVLEGQEPKEMDTPAVQAVKAKTKAPYSHATNDQARRGVPEHESFATVRRVTLQGLRMSSPIKLGEASLQLRHNKRLPWLQRLRRRQTTSLHWPRSTTFISPPPFYLSV